MQPILSVTNGKWGQWKMEEPKRPDPPFHEIFAMGFNADKSSNIVHNRTKYQRVDKFNIIIVIIIIIIIIIYLSTMDSNTLIPQSTEECWTTHTE